MLLDQNAVLSDAQALSANAASTNVIDLTAKGECVPGSLFFAARTAVAFSGTGNLGVALQTDDNSNFSNAVSLLSVSFPASLLAAAGQILCEVPLPKGLKRYVRAYYTVPNTLSGGSVSCFITDAVNYK